MHPDPAMNVDPLELEKFSQLAHRWWDPESEFKPLHEINPLRLDHIDAIAALRGKTVLDVGCGGGILSLNVRAGPGCLVPGGQEPSLSAHASCATAAASRFPFACPQGLYGGDWIAGGALVSPPGSVLPLKQLPGLWGWATSAISPLVGFPKLPLLWNELLETTLPNAW